jgi:hypothetical protein
MNIPWPFILLGGFYTLCAIIWVIGRIKKIPLDIKEKERIEQLEKSIHEREILLQEHKALFEREQKRFEELKAEAKIALEKISKEKALGFPWLATAYSDYLKLFESKVANELEHKKHPASNTTEHSLNTKTNVMWKQLLKQKNWVFGVRLDGAERIHSLELF